MKLKRFLTKKWHGIPVAIVSALLALVLVAGGVLAAGGYNFFNASVAVEVEEAITPSYGAVADDLAPYMVDGSPLPLIELVSEDWGPPIVFSLAVSAKEEEDPGYDASEFLPGEELVLPINLRNRSNAVMPIGVTVAGDLDLKWTFETNTSGSVFKPSESWTAFPADFDITTRGSFGSAEVGATVLFVKIGVPTDAAPGTYDLTFTFTRG